ncbi:MAG: hypothetical protein JJU07_05695 [Natronohydrobacter sp.]|nr:hypothetical protein [Natronohydrobacter sp.]
MGRVKSVLAGVVVLGFAPAVLAQQSGAERYQLDGVEVTVVTHGFLSEDELMTLRLVGQNREALSIFIPEGSGFAALAVAPNEGFLRAGMPVDSASAISGLPDIGTARDAALDACNAARNGGPDCQIVLEVAPR